MTYDLIVRKRTLANVPLVDKDKQEIKSPRWWELLLRDNGPVETNYNHIAYMDDRMAEAIMESGKPIWWVFGDDSEKNGSPNWDTIWKEREVHKKRRLFEELKKEFEPEQKNG
jgi:hypothetical protein